MFRSIVFIVVTTIVASRASAIVVDFEDLSLPGANAHYDQSTFTSHGAFFNNSSVPNFWTGFAYSNVNDTTTAGYNNQYAAITSSGAGGGGIYGIGYDAGEYGVPVTITFPYLVEPQAVKLTNTTYAFLAMRDGNDGFGVARQFGAQPGHSGEGNQGYPDWFKVAMVGDDGAGHQTTLPDFYLADYRASDNAGDYIISDWTSVDLSGLGLIRTLTFTVSTSDVSFGFANTPLYFAIDDLTFVPEPAMGICVLMGLLSARRTVRR